MLKDVIHQLWQEGRLALLPAPRINVGMLIRRVFQCDPPAPIQEYYELVPGGAIGGIPLIGVNFSQEGNNLIAEYEFNEKSIKAGYWPVAGDGCGNYYHCFEFEPKCYPVGFVETGIDPIVPRWIVASSLETLMLGLASSEHDGSEWPYGEGVEKLDPKRRVLDARFQQMKTAGDN